MLCMLISASIAMPLFGAECLTTPLPPCPHVCAIDASEQCAFDCILSGTMLRQATADRCTRLMPMFMHVHMRQQPVAARPAAAKVEAFKHTFLVRQLRLPEAAPLTACAASGCRTLPVVVVTRDMPCAVHEMRINDSAWGQHNRSSSALHPICIWLVCKYARIVQPRVPTCTARHA